MHGIPPWQASVARQPQEPSRGRTPRGPRASTLPNRCSVATKGGISGEVPTLPCDSTYLLSQDPAKVFESATMRLIAQFDTAPGVDTVLGLDFDRTVTTRARGAVAWERYNQLIGETRYIQYDPAAQGVSRFRTLVCPAVRFDWNTQELLSTSMQFVDPDSDGIPTVLLGVIYKTASPPLPNPRTIYAGEYVPRK